MACGVYLITCVSTGKCYVGSSVNVKKRLTEHRRALRKNTHYNKHLQWAWNKHGEERFEFKLLEETGRIERRARELHWIEQLSAQFNMAIPDPESGGWTVTEQTRQRMASAIHLRPANWGAKVSRSLLGRPFGVEHLEQLRLSHRTEKFKANQSEVMKRRYLDPAERAKIGELKRNASAETRAKLSRAAKGKELSAEHRAKLSKSHMGQKHSPESYAKQAASMKASWAKRKAMAKNQKP